MFGNDWPENLVVVNNFGLLFKAPIFIGACFYFMKKMKKNDFFAKKYLQFYFLYDKCYFVVPA